MTEEVSLANLNYSPAMSLSLTKECHVLVQTSKKCRMFSHKRHTRLHETAASKPLAMTGRDKQLESNCHWDGESVAGTADGSAAKAFALTMPVALRCPGGCRWAGSSASVCAGQTSTHRWVVSALDSELEVAGVLHNTSPNTNICSSSESSEFQRSHLVLILVQLHGYSLLNCFLPNPLPCSL